METLNEGLGFGAKYGEKLGWTENASALNEDAVQQFQTSMDDDFNTPGAVAALFGLAKELNRQSNLIVHEGDVDADATQIQQQWQTLVQLADVLGLQAQDSGDAVSDSGLSDRDIETLIEQRIAAKQAKNYAESDRIRDELSAQGITLIDKPGGVTNWHR